MEYMEEKNKNIPLGQLLIQNHKITEEQLVKALEEQKKTRDRLGHTLIKLNYIGEDELIEILEKQFGIPAVKINLKMLNPMVVKTIPEYICRKYRLIPILLENDKLTIATTNPYDLSFRDEIKFTTDYNTEIVLSPENSVLEAINYSFGEKGTNWISQEDKIDKGEMKAKISAAKMLEQILHRAINRRAKEIQLEYLEDDFIVLYIVPNSTISNELLPAFYYNAISLRIKSLANLDLEKKSFQEGLLRIKIDDQEYSLRALIFPTPQGENITLQFP